MQRTNRRRDALPTGYILPEIIDPPQTLCICVPVPNEPAHRAAFLGQILQLARWYGWEQDDAHTGKEVAAVWMNIWVIVRNQMSLQPRNCGCGCGDGVQQRLNADGTISISTDGGATWTPAAPSQDPRTSGSYQAPIDASDNEKKCAAANSAVAYFKQAQAQTYAKMNASAGAAELAALFIALLVAVGVIATGGALAVLGAGLGALLASFDASGWNALFTDDLWTDLLCEIYCRMDETGLVTQSDALAAAAAVKAAHPDRAGEYIFNLLTGMGQVGLTNAIRLGLDGSMSCDTCDCNPGWCFEFDFTVDDGGWSALYGTWVSGTGWVGTAAGLGVSIVLEKASLPSATYTHIEMTYTAAGTANAVVAVDGTPTVDVTNQASGTYTWDGTITGTDVVLNPSSGSTQGADVTLTSVKFMGTGDNPFGTDNCS